MHHINLFNFSLCVLILASSNINAVAKMQEHQNIKAEQAREFLWEQRKMYSILDDNQVITQLQEENKALKEQIKSLGQTPRTINMDKILKGENPFAQNLPAGNTSGFSWKMMTIKALSLLALIMALFFAWKKSFITTVMSKINAKKTSVKTVEASKPVVITAPKPTIIPQIPTANVAPVVIEDKNIKQATPESPEIPSFNLNFPSFDDAKIHPIDIPIIEEPIVISNIIQNQEKVMVMSTDTQFISQNSSVVQDHHLADSSFNLNQEKYRQDTAEAILEKVEKSHANQLDYGRFANPKEFVSPILIEDDNEQQVPQELTGALSSFRTRKLKQVDNDYLGVFKNEQFDMQPEEIIRSEGFDVRDPLANLNIAQTESGILSQTVPTIEISSLLENFTSPTKISVWEDDETDKKIEQPKTEIPEFKIEIPKIQASFSEGMPVFTPTATTVKETAAFSNLDLKMDLNSLSGFNTFKLENTAIIHEENTIISPSEGSAIVIDKNRTADHFADFEIKLPQINL